MTSCKHGIVAALAIASLGIGAMANAAGAPKFIEVGKLYTLQGFGGGQGIKVLEVDRESGWIKVQTEKPKTEIMWLNTSQIPSLREGAPDPEKRPSQSAAPIKEYKY